MRRWEWVNYERVAYSIELSEACECVKWKTQNTVPYEKRANKTNHNFHLRSKKRKKFISSCKLHFPVPSGFDAGEIVALNECVYMWWSEEGIELSGLVRLRGFPALLLRISIKCKIVEDLATMQYSRLFLSRRVSN